MADLVTVLGSSAWRCGGPPPLGAQHRERLAYSRHGQGVPPWRHIPRPRTGASCMFRPLNSARPLPPREWTPTSPSGLRGQCSSPRVRRHRWAQVERWYCSGRHSRLPSRPEGGDSARPSPPFCPCSNARYDTGEKLLDNAKRGRKRRGPTRPHSVALGTQNDAAAPRRHPRDMAEHDYPGQPDWAE
jgi:hypothetical protein